MRPVLIIVQPRYGTCSEKRHETLSKIPQNKVPLRNFLQYPDNPKSRVCKRCIDCRKQYRIRDSEYSKKRKDQFQQDKISGKEEIFCPNNYHSRSGSKYPREKVPIELFKKNPSDKNSGFYDSCIDCRNHMAMDRSEIVAKKKDFAKNNMKDGEFHCASCLCIKLESERAIKRNGEKSKSCISCGKKMIELNTKNREYQNELKIEMMIENGCSCQKCKGIYIKNEKDFAEKLDTYEIEGKRFVEYRGETFDSKEFMSKFTNILELRVIEMDHLTKEEQLKRGIIKNEEEFIEKKKCISDCKGKDEIKNEFKITQNLCSLCHLEETVSREKGKQENWKRKDRMFIGKNVK